jgi:hypothetical protein
VIVLGVFAAAGPAAAERRAPAAAPPPTDTRSHTSFGAELGPGGVISQYNRNAGPSGVLFYGSLRAGYEINDQWTAELVLRQWWLPANHALMLGVGARWEPMVLSFGRWFVDAAIGPASTSNAWTFGYDIGGGFEWDIPDVPGVALGPYVRYGSVINPDRNDPQSNDGRAWTVGASFTYNFGRAESAPKSSMPKARRPGGAYHVTIPDTDGDGVADDEDQCRDVKQGKHPDPFRLGCPEADEDGDGVPDTDDACPLQAAGDKPDPRRPGCPFLDSDGDGIPDGDDACPTKAGKASEDPLKNGCPPGKRKGAVEEEGEPPPESNPAPKSVKKRSMH